MLSEPVLNDAPCRFIIEAQTDNWQTLITCPSIWLYLLTSDILELLILYYWYRVLENDWWKNIGEITKILKKKWCQYVTLYYMKDKVVHTKLFWNQTVVSWPCTCGIYTIIKVQSWSWNELSANENKTAFSYDKSLTHIIRPKAVDTPCIPAGWSVVGRHSHFLQFSLVALVDVTELLADALQSSQPFLLPGAVLTPKADSHLRNWFGAKY